MLVCDKCKINKKVHRDISFGFPFYERLPTKKDVTVAAYYGIKGDYCENCLKEMLSILGYKHKSTKEFTDKQIDEMK